MLAHPPQCPRALSALLVLLVSFAVPARATQVVGQDTPTLARGSSDIVIGEVAGTRSHWNDARTRIVTDVTVRVAETLKGAGPATITLTQLGGDVDGMHLEVEGSPVFRVGQRSVLFLWRDARGRAQVNGLAQGKYDIERGANGRDVVRRDLAGLTLREAGTLRLARAAAPETPVALDDFKAAIRRALATSAGADGKGGPPP